MYGITDRYLAGHTAENAAFVHVLLGELESRIHSFFSVVWLNFLFEYICSWMLSCNCKELL